MACGHRKGTSVRRVFAALVPTVLFAAAGANAETARASLFSNEARAPVAVREGLLLRESGIGDGGERGPSRIARVDFSALGRIREGVASGQAANLRLNLLHDVEFEAAIERSAPTSSGYSLSGPLVDVPFGRAVLVVNGDYTVGRVYTPKGVYAVRTTGSLQSVERMAPQPLRCAAVERNRGSAAQDDADRKPKAAWSESKRIGTGPIKPAPRAKAPPVDPSPRPASQAGSGEAVDVLVVYPSFVRELEGGYERMLGTIDLDFAVANDAYAASGVDLRINLAAAVEVEYDRFADIQHEEGLSGVYLWRDALEQLSRPDSGHLDGVHALRDRHAADLVLLHLGGDVLRQLFDRFYVGGIAWALFDVSDDVLENDGFSVARSGDGTYLAHELGHSMGLHHDRSEGSRNQPYAYSHGFRYRDPTEPEPQNRWWDGTIMSNYRRATGPLVFSNPALSHPDDPDLKLGVPGDEPSPGPEGPADAVRHLNEVRRIVANVRARADADNCTYEISGDGGMVPAEGGTYRIQVETGADCQWSASGGEWVESVAPGNGTGNGVVEYRVAGNDGWQRPVEVLVSGRLHARRQAGSRPITPVCERAIWGFLARQHPDYGLQTHTPCRALTYTPEYLAGIRHLYGPEFRGIEAENRDLKPGDFDGLTGVVALDINGMTHVPADLFSGMVGLRSIEFGFNYIRTPRLRSIAPGAFRGLPGLWRLGINGHRIGVFEPGTFQGMPQLRMLAINGRYAFDPEGHTPVTRIDPGAMAGLENLRALSFTGHNWGHLEAGAFDGLDRLNALRLSFNQLKTVAPGALDGLGELRSLNMRFNRVGALPAGLLSDLSSLTELVLWSIGLTRLSDGAFEGLGSLEYLNLASNRLTALAPGTFSGLPNLERLDLQNNGLKGLSPGVFEGLESLDDLFLRDNRLGTLRRGVFDGLDRLHALHLLDAGVTSLDPGVFDDTPALRILDLQQNRLSRIAPGTFRELYLLGLHLEGNPGAPFAFSPRPVAYPTAEPVAGRPVEVAVESLPEAPFSIDTVLGAQDASLSHPGVYVSSGRSFGNGAVSVTPDGDGPVTVRLERVRWRGEDAGEDETDPGNGGGGVRLIVDHRYGYSGFRVEPGPPLVLYGIEDRSLTLGRGSESIELAGVFSYFLGFADYEAASSDGAVAAVSVEDGTLTVAPGAAGTAQVTVTATAPDGETMTRSFAVTVRIPSVPLFLSGSNPAGEGFVRLVNRSGRAGSVRITAFDDAGHRRGPVSLRLKAHGAAHFNSGDLEEGNAAKGLAEGIGFGEGDWRLEFETDLEIEALAYARTADGFVAAVHDAAPAEGSARRIATFNPASNDRQASRLRVVNPGREAAAVTVRGIDDAGASPGGPVRFTVPAGAAREFDAVQLESGDMALEGALGDGEGKWRLEVESEAPIVAMSLLESTATGHLTNLSSGPPPDADGVRHVPLLPAASGGNGREGFVRVINRSDRAGTVRIDAYDDAGNRQGPLELSIDGGAAKHFNSSDLEFGNAAKGLSGSAGAGEGDWRLELASGLDIDVLAYVRTEDGFLTAAHDVPAFEGGRRWVPFFNPGSNHRQVSRLRLVNPTPRAVEVTVVGTDDTGGAPPNRGAAWVTVPAREALTLDAAELEAGLVSQFYMDFAEQGDDVDGYETFSGYWERRPLGDGTGK